MSSHILPKAIKEVVAKKMDEHIAFEEEIYGIYLESFVKNFHKFLNVDIKINQQEKLSLDFDDLKAISQRIFGDVNFVMALFASKHFFINLASNYGSEKFTEFDEMVIDSVKEFLNVLNGYYTILMAKHDFVLDLEIPRHGRKVILPLENHIEFRFDTECGSFLLVFLTGEIIA